MIQPAMADVVETLLTQWFSTVATWSAPGRLRPETCGHCITSSFHAALGLDRWPHDLAHDLVVRLEGVVSAVHDSVDEDGAAELWLPAGAFGSDDLVCSVRHAVESAVRGRRGDIADMLAECVEPRMSAHVDEALERGLEQIVAGYQQR